MWELTSLCSVWNISNKFLKIRGFCKYVHGQVSVNDYPETSPLHLKTACRCELTCFMFTLLTTEIVSTILLHRIKKIVGQSDYLIDQIIHFSHTGVLPIYSQGSDQFLELRWWRNKVLFFYEYRKNGGAKEKDAIDNSHSY